MGRHCNCTGRNGFWKRNRPNGRKSKKSSPKLLEMVRDDCPGDSLHLGGVFVYLQRAAGKQRDAGGVFALFFIVALGILFDMVGVAVTAADEKPFHAMAAKKVPGAGKAIWLLRNADKVASFCNDVVGDICGIISGAASAVIAGQIIAEIAQTGRGNVVQLAMSGLVAGMTVGGKAAGKSIAMRCSTNIVFLTARVLGLFSRKKK